MSNELLNQKVESIHDMYVQRHCEKHEYIQVTQTTTTTNPIINTTQQWWQCKHCGKRM